MSTVRSSDGTTIAYDRSGDGAAVILVDGALCHRKSGPSGLAAKLAPRFTVYTYDRRGRGESADAAPYAVDREVEDIEALIDAAGGRAHVYGISSGAVLALEVARRGAAIDRLALYEPPFIVDDSRPAIPADYRAQLDACIESGRRGDAVRLFMRQVGVPSVLVALMRLAPAWSRLEAVAHTLAYDAEVMGETQAGAPLPAGRWAGVTTPTMVVVGGKSPTWFHHGTGALADALPNADHRVLDGQTHMVKAKALAPLLSEFFAGPSPAELVAAPIPARG
jgi:pimeloyl-ACP methyl ester carboxylesterase